MAGFFIDPLYLIISIPALLLGLWAQSRVQGAFNQYSKVRTGSGVTGAQAARTILDHNGLQRVGLQQIGGTLSDHYDPGAKVLRLSKAVYELPSIASVGVAAHVVGKKALAQAKEIDAELVDRWVRTPNPDRVLAFNGGLARRDEIRRLLVDAWADAPAGGSSAYRRNAGWASLAGAGLAAALGVGLYFVRRKRGFGQPSSWLAWRSDPFSRWLRAFFPALSQAELGEGGKVGLSVLVFSLVAMLPLLLSLGVVLPLGSSLAAALPWALFALGLLLYVGFRLRSELGERE